MPSDSQPKDKTDLVRKYLRDIESGDWRTIGYAADQIGMLAFDETDPDVIEGTAR